MLYQVLGTTILISAAVLAIEIVHSIYLHFKVKQLNNIMEGTTMETIIRIKVEKSKGEDWLIPEKVLAALILCYPNTLFEVEKIKIEFTDEDANRLRNAVEPQLLGIEIDGYERTADSIERSLHKHIEHILVHKYQKQCNSNKF